MIRSHDFRERQEQLTFQVAEALFSTRSIYAELSACQVSSQGEHPNSKGWQVHRQPIRSIWGKPIQFSADFR
jgi:hypothetical protein